MQFEQKIRGLQDSVRNSGWRIQWIPWQQPGKLEYIYNTPFTLFTGLGGALLFIGGIAYAARSGGASDQSELIIGIAVAVGGLIMGIAGRFYAAWFQQRNWIPVTARVIDREIREVQSPDSGNSTTWDFRLLCTLWHEGREYTVTPESPQMVAMNTLHAAERYLAQNINTDNTCTLYIDPGNPLHAVFRRKRRV